MEAKRKTSLPAQGSSTGEAHPDDKNGQVGGGSAFAVDGAPGAEENQGIGSSSVPGRVELAPFASAEGVFSSARPLQPPRIEPGAFFKKPVHMLPNSAMVKEEHVKLYEPQFSGLFRPEKRFAQEELLDADIPYVMQRLFSDEAVLRQTVESVGNGVVNGPVQLEVVTHHQKGKRGHIRLCRALPKEGDPLYFVTHIARFPEDDSRSGHLQKEYEDLRSLSGLFEENLPSEVLSRYSVVRPAAFGVSGGYRGRQYPFFTMPFVAKGELHQNWKSPDLLHPYPFFMYALPYTDGMWDTIHKQTAEAYTHKGVERHKQLSRDLLVANGLIYHLTGGRMLRDMRINAGDWMADIYPPEGARGMDLTLVSIQNGLTDPVPETEWIRRMKDHEEICEVPIIGYEHDAPVWTFFNWPDTFFAECLREARQLVGK